MFEQRKVVVPRCLELGLSIFAKLDRRVAICVAAPPEGGRKALNDPVAAKVAKARRGCKGRRDIEALNQGFVGPKLYPGISVKSFRSDHIVVDAQLNAFVAHVAHWIISDGGHTS